MEKTAMEGNLRTGLERMRDALHELENAARKLQNQNFADIVKSASGRVHQLTQHPDLDKVHDHLEPERAGPFPGSGEAEHDEAREVQRREQADGAQALSGKADGVKSGAPFPT